ncbi:hypothetical protein MOQ72_30840 [Saccharopolyspora sp. K220]|uniref:hypothetical protein n=1 Tax=Saccharopolyspora soli TaxID=2926618 RepID=UPI001F56DA51|nr:hypothetical protein [Saccharopolyspora soli]MCI2421841.1 hypothetical protein [Saccharopolyspora soli]
MLEEKIRERRQTLEEFAEYAEQFAREHNEPGTLGVRHLQRLASGRGPKGQPLGPVRPATARLLERILGLSIDELLAPSSAEPPDDSAAELRQMIHASRRVDGAVLGLLREQLTAIRRLDRQLGAVIAYDEVCAKTNQVGRLLTHSLPGKPREQLAALLSELHTLAGWQALDLGKTIESWQHYEQAKQAARESSTGAFEVHTAAEQAFVLLDIGETKAAVELLATARRRAESTCSRLLKSWLAAAHGEALAAHNRRDDSLRAFDTAVELLPAESSDPEGPYVVLDSIHLARWRGHALARFADPEAVDVLSTALEGLDASFTRAETALRVDLANAFAAIGEREAVKIQIDRAERLASTIGSVRQKQRIRASRAP